MLTSRTARWVSGTVLLCVALLALTWLFLVSPQRTEAAQLRDQNASTQSQNDLLEVKIAQLRAQFAKLPESQAELAAILAQMPPDAGMPRLVRDLDSMAKATGVVLASVTPSAAQTLSTGTTGAGTAGAAATAPAAAPAATAAPAAGAAGAAQGGQVVQIPVTVSVTGDYFQTVAFMKQLQTQMPRAFLVTAVQMSAGETGQGGGGQVAVTISGRVFALPGATADVLTSGATAGAAATAGSPMGAVSPSPGVTASPAASATAAPSVPAPATPAAGSTQEVS